MREYETQSITVPDVPVRLENSITQPAPPSLGTYWRTLRHLRWSQLGYLARRRVLGRNNLARWSVVPVQLRRLSIYPTFPEWQPDAARRLIEAGEISFLKQTSATTQLSWSVRELGRIRLYELNYCDFLNVDLTRRSDEPLLRAALRIALTWWQQNSTGRELGWEPFPLSLRIVNWVKFVIRNAARAEELEESLLAQMLSSLRIQVLSLEERLERDLLANHLLKNIKALMFAGALLEAPESRRWWIMGENLLKGQLREQILSDGGHVERSPMYHVWLLEHLLDLEELVSSSPRPVSCALQISDCVTQMSNFLHQILHPDGEIPLFNDSAFSFITRPTAEVLSRAQLKLGKFPEARPGVSVLSKTGYAVIREPISESYLIFDCGPLGPDYQPGHGHCDVLSYELSLNKQRAVVDTGVSTYEIGQDRHYERSTAAHNTLRIDGEEQAEIWGGFRVGRRPRVSRIQSGAIQEMHYVRGTHFGYRYLGVIHSRTIILAPDNSWIVVDSLQGSGRHRVESFVHFHPAIRVEPRPNGASASAELSAAQWIIHSPNSRYFLRNLHEGRFVARESWYSPEFGLRQSQFVLQCTWEGELPMKLMYSFEPSESKPLIVHLPDDREAVMINDVLIPLD